MSTLLKSKSPKETQKIGINIAKNLQKGNVVALIGELGAGKTCITQAMMKGLGVKERYTGTSPTFVIITEYKGRMPVYHFDVYRINDIKDIMDLGYEEYFYGNGVAIIEWADKVSEILPKNCVKITLKITGAKEREILIEGLEYRKL